MQITWHGQYTVKITTKETILVLDPYDTSVGLPPFRAKADIIGLSNPNDSTMSNLSGIQGEPIVVNTPGEYSLDGLSLHAAGWVAEDGSERSVQRWTIEHMTILHLGAIKRELADEELQELERVNIDILLVPVGGGSGLDTKQALHMVTTIEPRIVIPIHYHIPKLREKLDTVDQFAKEMGIDPKKKEKKLLIRANKLPQEDIETVLLHP
jgi:L-ascorbate metabolism protein UlaG (beta-lactamase superfamily)